MKNPAVLRPPRRGKVPLTDRMTENANAQALETPGAASGASEGALLLQAFAREMVFRLTFPG
jgi:hypothetical protein